MKRLFVALAVALLSPSVLAAQPAELPTIEKVRNYLPHMTVPEVQDLLTRSDMVIIPVASLEQHGLRGIELRLQVGSHGIRSVVKRWRYGS